MVHVDGAKVPTKALIPVECGPTKLEVLKSVCAALKGKQSLGEEFALPAPCSAL